MLKSLVASAMERGSLPTRLTGPAEVLSLDAPYKLDLRVVGRSRRSRATVRQRNRTDSYSFTFSSSRLRRSARDTNCEVLLDIAIRPEDTDKHW